MIAEIQLTSCTSIILQFLWKLNIFIIIENSQFWAFLKSPSRYFLIGSRENFFLFFSENMDKNKEPFLLSASGDAPDQK